MDLIQQYIYVRHELIELTEKWPTDKQETILFNQWSIKNVLAHMARWDNCLADNLVCLKQDKEPPFYGKVNDFNDQSMSLSKDWNWEKTVTEFKKAGKRLVDEYQTLDRFLWQTKFWKTKNSTPEKFLKIVTDHYLKHHLPEIKQVFDQIQ